MRISRLIILLAIVGVAFLARQKGQLQIEKSKALVLEEKVKFKGPVESLDEEMTRASEETPMTIDNVDQDLMRIKNLSAIVLDKRRKMNSLRPLLQKETILKEIHSALLNPRTYSGKMFHRKLRLLDALYEGLNFPDEVIREKYTSEVATIFSEPIPDSYKGNSEWSRQFRADRVEMAMVLLKTMPKIAEEIKQRTAGQSDDYFRQGQRLQSLYEVAL